MRAPRSYCQSAAHHKQSSKNKTYRDTEKKRSVEFALSVHHLGYMDRHTKMQQMVCTKVITTEVYSSTIKLSKMKSKKEYVREALERVNRLNLRKKKKTRLSLFEKFNSGGYFVRLIKQNRDEKL